jgi:hypothetical protein
LFGDLSQAHNILTINSVGMLSESPFAQNSKSLSFLHYKVNLWAKELSTSMWLAILEESMGWRSVPSKMQGGVSEVNVDYPSLIVRN